MIDDSTPRPEINVNIVLWDELEKESQDNLDKPIKNNSGLGNYSIFGSIKNMGMVILPAFQPDDLVSLMSRYRPGVKYDRFIVTTIVIHNSIADQLGMKKKIESILSLKCFW